MNPLRAMRVAAILGFLAVALGAFGAHALKDVLARNPEAKAIWQTAVFYHFIHAVMLYVLASRPVLRRGPYWAFLAGIVIFSGSLYALALSGIPWLGAITPIGGICLLVGWGCLACKQAKAE